MPAMCTLLPQAGLGCLAQGKHPRPKSCNSKKGGAKEEGRQKTPVLKPPRELPSQAAGTDNPAPLPIPQGTVSPGVSESTETATCLFPIPGGRRRVPPTDRLIGSGEGSPGLALDASPFVSLEACLSSPWDWRTAGKSVGDRRGREMAMTKPDPARFSG